MDKHLYEVVLDGGRSNKDFFAFLTNMGALKGKEPDYGGVNNVCVVAHHMDARTVHLLATENFDGDGTDVTVTEITRESLSDRSGSHRIYTELIENYFLPYGRYPAISGSRATKRRVR